MIMHLGVLRDHARAGVLRIQNTFAFTGDGIKRNDIHTASFSFSFVEVTPGSCLSSEHTFHLSKRYMHVTPSGKPSRVNHEVNQCDSEATVSVILAKFTVKKTLVRMAV